MRNRLILLAIYALLVGAVLFLALAPGPDTIEVFGWDKLNHALAFIVLAGFAELLWPRPSFTIPFLLLANLGGLIEILQGAMGYGRDADWHDLLADIIAIVIGWLLAKGALALAQSGRLPWIRRVSAEDDGEC